jgi:hypothetical protein
MADTKFKEGHEKVGGRKKGSKNKLSIDVQQTAFEIFEALGGVKEATEYFKKNIQTKGQFYNIFYKMLPSSITGTQGADGEFKPLEVKIVSNGNQPDNTP